MANALTRLFQRRPAMPINPRPMTEYGTSGTAVVGGYVITQERNASLVGTQRYRTAAEMLANISVIAAGMRYFLNLVAKPKWTVEPAKADGADKATPEAEQMAEFVQSVVDGSLTPWPRIIKRAAMYRFHGFGIHEWMAARDDEGQIIIEDVEVRPCHTILRWELEPRGKVIGAYQTDPITGQELALPIRKCIYLVDDTMTDSPEGMGWFRHLVDPWDRIKSYYKFEGQGFQRDLSGTPIGRAPFDFINQQVKAGQLSPEDGTRLVEAIKNIVKLQAKEPNTGIVLDSAMYPQQGADGKQVTAAPMWGLELLTGAQTSLDKIDKAIVRTMHDMAYILGVEGLLLGADGKGSLALSKDKSTNLYQNIESTMADLAAAFTRDYIDPLWIMNGFADELKPKFKTEQVAFKDVEAITAGLRDMATAGAILMPDDPIIDEVRELWGMPPQPEVDPETLAMMQRGAMGGPIDEPPEEDPNAPPGNKPPPKGVGKKRRRPFAKYDPDQPRDPAGTSTGGQWTGGSAGGAAEAQGPPVAQRALDLVGGQGSDIGMAQTLTAEGLKQQYNLSDQAAKDLHDRLHFTELSAVNQARIILMDEKDLDDLDADALAQKYGLNEERASKVEEHIEFLHEMDSTDQADKVIEDEGLGNAVGLSAKDLADQYGLDSEQAQEVMGHIEAKYQEMQAEMDEEESDSDDGFYDDDAYAYATSDDLTPDEKSALGMYQGDGFKSLNMWLSGRIDPTKGEGTYTPEGLAKFRDRLDSAIAKSTTDSDLTVYRGGRGWDVHNWPDQVGKEIEFKSYTSTSVSVDSAEEFAGNTSYEIKVPSGSNAIYMNQHLGRSNELAKEQELLLPRGSRFYVAKVDAVKRKVYLELRS